MLWILLSCIPEAGVVVMNGVLHDAPDSQGNLVSGAALEVVGEDLSVVGSAITETDGTFVVDVPAGQPFYLTISGEGYVPTGFSGTAGMGDFYAGDGYPWVVTPEFLASEQSDFANCPTVADSGGAVLGQVRLYVSGSSDFSQLPLISTAIATVYTTEGTAITTCYLDDEGESVPDGSETGPSGRFAAFGVPAGGAIVEISFLDGSGLRPAVLYSFVMAENGVIPLFPALVYEGDL